MEKELWGLLTPKNIKHRKTRLGPNYDGGYVIPEILLEKCSALYTYGVGENIGFEAHFLDRYTKPIYTYDHTINWEVPYQFGYKKEGLGFGENLGDYLDHYTENNTWGEAFLKLDIEGGEYPYFLNCNMEKLSKITNGICMEVHYLDEPEKMKDFVNIMKRISNYFDLIHIHANNFGGNFIYDDRILYQTLELTFIRKDYTGELSPIKTKYPMMGLDFSNNGMVDYPIWFLD